MPWHLLPVLMSLALALPVSGQVVRGAGGERTEVIWDGERPLVISHLDSLGNTISLKAFAYPGEGLHPSQVTFFKDEKNWERRSYTYSGDRVLTMAVYGPSGLRDSLSAEMADTSAFRRALRTALPKAPDPAAEWELALEASTLCEEDPSLSPDPLDGEAFLFSADGRFLSRIRSSYGGGPLVMWQGEGRAPVVANFADPGYDPSHVGPESRVRLVLTDDIADAMGLCGAERVSWKGLFPGSFFLLRNSSYGGTLDFAVRPEYGISSHTFYLTSTEKEGSLAHNHFNFGNFLWGASAREVGVPLWMAKLGSHLNSFFLSPDTRFHLDSPDDILSISAGHHWRPDSQF